MDRSSLSTPALMPVSPCRVMEQPVGDAASAHSLKPSGYPFAPQNQAMSDSLGPYTIWRFTSFVLLFGRPMSTCPKFPGAALPLLLLLELLLLLPLLEVVPLEVVPLEV